MIVREGQLVCDLIGLESDRSFIARVCGLLQDSEELVDEEDVGADGGHEGLHHPYAELDHNLGGPVLVLT